MGEYTSRNATPYGELLQDEKVVYTFESVYESEFVAAL